MGPSNSSQVITIDPSLVSVMHDLAPRYIGRYQSSWFEKLSSGRDNLLVPSNRLTRLPRGSF